MLLLKNDWWFYLGSNTELDAVSSFSEIVPDTVIFDDFERYTISRKNGIGTSFRWIPLFPSFHCLLFYGRETVRTILRVPTLKFGKWYYMLVLIWLSSTSKIWKPLKRFKNNNNNNLLYLLLLLLLLLLGRQHNWKNKNWKFISFHFIFFFPEQSKWRGNAWIDGFVIIQNLGFLQQQLPLAPHSFWVYVAFLIQYLE